METSLASAREREAATRHVLTLISTHRDDERPVFEAILEKAQALCNAPMSGLILGGPEDALQRLAAHRGLMHGASRLFETGQMKMDGDLSYAARSIIEGRLVAHDDMGQSDLYTAGSPIVRSMVDDSGIRSVLFVPLIRGGSAIGTITLFRKEVAPFNAQEIALVETFAAQAVIAIENVRQFREVQLRLEREKASGEILHAISASRADHQQVFDILLDRAIGLLDSDHGSVWLLSDDDRWIEAVARKENGAEIGAAFDRRRMDQPDSVVAGVIRNAAMWQTDDLQSDATFAAADHPNRIWIEQSGARSMLLVPLVSDLKAIGMIAVYRRQVAPYSADHVALLQNFAAQAVIAIENVRQFREVQLRLEREQATRGILEVISRSRDDAQPVFDAILRAAARLCEAPLAFLSMADDSRTTVTVPAYLGVRPDFAAVLDAFVEPITRTELVAVRPIADGEVAHIADIADHEAYRQRDPRRVQMVEVEGARTAMGVPLLRNGEGIGAIVLYRREVQPFSEDQIELVRTFAAQAVIAIENVRQFRELKKRLERDQATGQVLNVISRSRSDDAPVFEAILDNACRLCDVPFAGLYLVDEEQQAARLVASRGARTEYIRRVSAEWALDGMASVPRAIRSGEVVHVQDLAETDLYRQGDPQRVDAVEIEGIRTFLAVPLMLEGRAIGCMGLYRREVKAFGPDQIALLETFAEQAVIAIENVRQFRALEDRTAEVEALNAGLESRVARQVDELERMGRLKRFLSPQVAEAVVSSGDDAILGSHRALISILFCDIRGFTAFCERAEPEEAIEVLQTYHQALGQLVQGSGAGFDTRAGDGIMVVFNDPIPCDDPAGDALRLAVAMRGRMDGLCRDWRKLGHHLGFGVGISLGYATVGMVGFEGRYDYTASGTAVNLAARLCEHAEDREILLSARAATAVEDMAVLEQAGQLELKGFHAPVEVMRAVALTGEGA